MNASTLLLEHTAFAPPTLLSPEDHARVWSTLGVHARRIGKDGRVLVSPDAAEQFADVIETLLDRTDQGDFYVVGACREHGDVSVGLFHRGGVA
jgi:hypothetical protein